MKKIKGPIELFSEQVDNSLVSYTNSATADVMGIEGEIRENLGSWWKPLEEFTLGFNAAYIQSKVPLNNEQIYFRRTRDVPGSPLNDLSTSRPLYDQPEYVINGDLTWDHKATGTALTLVGGVVGRRLVLASLRQPDEYEEPAPQLDFFLSQKFGKHWKAKFSAKNLLDPVYKVTQTWGTSGFTTISRSYTKGMTFGFSMSCEF